MIYHRTPLQQIHNHPSLERAGVSLWIKREDLNHAAISGNKWWKLKYNLLEARRLAHDTLLTFGGTYSNHIYATAAAAAEEGFKSIGIIRGEEPYPLNPTLKFALEKGMRLLYVSRTEYKRKSSEEFIEELQKKFAPFFLIPEGGSNSLAVKGCAEFAEKELLQIPFDELVLPVGTGGTIAGLICGLNDRKNIIGVAILKGGEFLRNEIEKMAEDLTAKRYARWSLMTQYAQGGYAKKNRELVAFIEEMKTVYQLPLDHVYTGKMLWAVFREIESGRFARGTRILVLHTGGLQGASDRQSTT